MPLQRYGTVQTDRQTGRQADRQAGRQADSQTDRQTDTDTTANAYRSQLLGFFAGIILRFSSLPGGKVPEPRSAVCGALWAPRLVFP